MTTVEPQLEHHGQLRELHAATLWYQTLLVMLSPAFGMKHWYRAVTKSVCFSIVYSTTTTAGIMLTFCNQSSPLKPPMSYTRVNDFGSVPIRRNPNPYPNPKP